MRNRAYCELRYIFFRGLHPAVDVGNIACVGVFGASWSDTGTAIFLPRLDKITYQVFPHTVFTVFIFINEL